MVIVTVMGLADEHDALGCDLSGKPVQRESRVQIDHV